MSYASFVHALSRRMYRFGRAFIPFWIGLVGLFTLAASADSLWQFGWGYSWDDALTGFGMMSFGAAFWLAWNGMFSLQRRAIEALFGPQKRESDKRS